MTTKQLAAEHREMAERSLYLWKSAMKIEIDESTVRQLIATIREAQKFTSHHGVKAKLQIAAQTLEWHLPEEIAKAEGKE